MIWWLAIVACDRSTVPAILDDFGAGGGGRRRPGVLDVSIAAILEPGHRIGGGRFRQGHGLTESCRGNSGHRARGVVLAMAVGKG